MSIKKVLQICMPAESGCLGGDLLNGGLIKLCHKTLLPGFSPFVSGFQIKRTGFAVLADPVVSAVSLASDFSAIFASDHRLPPFGAVVIIIP